MLTQIFTKPIIDTQNYCYGFDLSKHANELFQKYGINLRVSYGGKVFYKIHSDALEVEIPYESLPKKLVTFIKNNIDKPRGVCGWYMDVKPNTVECWNDDHDSYWKNKI